MSFTVIADGSPGLLALMLSASHENIMSGVVM
jgi:hypothetical protein